MAWDVWEIWNPLNSSSAPFVKKVRTDLVDCCLGGWVILGGTGTLDVLDQFAPWNEAEDMAAKKSISQLVNHFLRAWLPRKKYVAAKMYFLEKFTHIGYTQVLLLSHAWIGLWCSLLRNKKISNRRLWCMIFVKKICLCAFSRRASLKKLYQGKKLVLQICASFSFNCQIKNKRKNDSWRALWQH